MDRGLLTQFHLFNPFWEVAKNIVLAFVEIIVEYLGTKFCEFGFIKFLNKFNYLGTITMIYNLNSVQKTCREGKQRRFNQSKATWVSLSFTYP